MGVGLCCTRRQGLLAAIQSGDPDAHLDFVDDSEQFRITLDANSMSGDGTLNCEEVAQTLRCFGLYPDRAQLSKLMSSLDLRVPLSFDETTMLARHLKWLGCRSGIHAVPFARRGMTMCQLKQIVKRLVHSGWLEKHCKEFNTTHEAMIRGGTMQEMKLNLYALDRFWVQPVTSVHPVLRRRVQPEMLCDLGIGVPSFSCCYSQLANPQGLAVHVYVSHFWGHAVDKTVSALDKYISRSVIVEAAQSEQIAVWICAFALNQHCVDVELGSSLEAAPFNIALAKASCGMAMVMDSNAEPLKRIWCLYEVVRAQELRKKLTLVDDAGARGDARKSSLLDIKTILLMRKIHTLSAYDADASVMDDKLSIWFKILDSSQKAFHNNELDAFKTSVLNPADQRFMVGPHSFSEFDSRMKGVLATPSLAAALETRVGQAALPYIGMGADCDVSQLQTLEDLGADLETKMTVRVAGVDSEAELAYIMARRGRSEELRFLCERGVDVNCRCTIPHPSTFIQRTHDGSTALHAAAECGGITCMSILLEYRADVNARSSAGTTPLFECPVSSDVVEKASLLLANRADPQVRSVDGDVALHVAAGFGHERLIELLLDKKAHVDVADKNGATALHTAVALGHLRVARLLLDRNAAIEATTTDGATPLDRAMSYEHESVVKFLLLCRADPRSRQTISLSSSFDNWPSE
eukprot:TRINITY_DN29491_c0_g1_i1.p1 TRINITY_DN29491_c0_g1~~TRINITY_DN29491_c0_g1_i1.p1  ORF type:complete len:701 (+),score=46.41 TRINITY_DN29491_c0_g1_i1:22-2103(+)